MKGKITGIIDPLSNFNYALRVEDTRLKYLQRLKFFFKSVLENENGIHSQAIEFMENARSREWVYCAFMSFTLEQNKRIAKGEATAGTGDAACGSKLRTGTARSAAQGGSPATRRVDLLR